MRVKTILFVLPILVITLIISTNRDGIPAPQTTRLTDITELSSIEVNLAWEPQFDLTGFLDLFIKQCYAALPPQYQPHYKHSLTFNHDPKTISDVFKNFTGKDPSLMEISKVKRGPTVYEKFQDFLVNTAFLCEVIRSDAGWVGPAQPLIIFHKTDGSVLKAYFYNCPWCQKKDFRLCSQAFSKYLLSLQTNR